MWAKTESVIENGSHFKIRRLQFAFDLRRKNWNIVTHGTIQHDVSKVNNNYVNRTPQARKNGFTRIWTDTLTLKMTSLWKPWKKNQLFNGYYIKMAAFAEIMVAHQMAKLELVLTFLWQWMFSKHSHFLWVTNYDL